MNKGKNVEKTIEDYLEAMLMIQEQQGIVRSIDVAYLLGVTKPSVTYTTKRLKERGYITMDENNFINLTQTGMAIASRTYEKHKILTGFFMHLGVDREIAMKDACLIEHVISDETYEKLRAWYKKSAKK